MITVSLGASKPRWALSSNGRANPSRSPVEVEVDIGFLAAVGSRPREAASQVHVGIELARRF